MSETTHGTEKKHDDDRRRHGWSERIDEGMRRMHSTRCRSSKDQKAGRKCECPYRVSFTGAGGKTEWKTIHGVSRAEARKARHRLMAEERAAVARVAEEAPRTLHDLTKRYLETKSATLKPSTIATTVRAYRTHVAPTLGSHKLPEITREVVQRWLADLASDGCSASQIKKAHLALSGVLSEAVEWGYLDVNPALRLRLPTSTVPPRSSVPEAELVLTRAQLRRLFNYASRRPDHEAMLRLAGQSGLRCGEIIGLHWGDLDLAARRVKVKRSVWQESAKGKSPIKHVGPPKSGKERRVAITAATAEVLGRWFETAVTRGHGGPEDPVFRHRSDGYLDAGTPGQMLRQALLKLDLVDAGGKPLVHFHGLRHTAASIMLTEGKPLLAVSRQLGHADVTITGRIYAHLVSDEALDDALTAFGEPHDLAADVAADSAA